MPKFGATAPTASMVKAGLSWSSIRNYAEKSIKLIQDHGDEFLGMIDAGYRGITAVAEMDMASVFAELSAVEVNAEKLIAAIKTTFEIE